MHVINHRQFAKRTGGRTKRVQIVLYCLVGLFALLLLTSAILSLVYRNKALPNYTLGGVKVGGMSYKAVQQLNESNFLPKEVVLQKDTQKKQVTTRDLGIQVDWAKSVQNLKNARPLLPITAYFGTHDVAIALATDDKKLSSTLASLQTIFSQSPTDKRIVFKDSAFVTENAKAGYVFDSAASKTIVVKAIAKGITVISVTTKPLPAGSNATDLSAQLSILQKQLQTKVTFVYKSQKITVSVADMGNWYTPAGQSMALSDANIGTFIDKTAGQFGISPANKGDLITATEYAVEKGLTMSFTMVPSKGSATRTYCTSVRGVSTLELPDLIGKLAATYADPRGWNDGGAVAFQHVASGCDYNVVLAAPNQMTSFGEICDDYYNCQVGNSVIVNNDRWLYATDPWNRTGQNLETYRLLIINHETGHRLGFRDSNVCSGPGQPAPVMLQQSIDLKGCAFNVWPLQSELDALGL